MSSIAFLLLNLALAKEPTMNTLKVENERLKKENYELAVQVGLLESEISQLEAVNQAKPPVLIQKVQTVLPIHVYRVNRLSVLTGSQSNRDKLLGGVQYQRMLNSRISFGGQVQTNDTVLLNLGLEF